MQQLGSAMRGAHPCAGGGGRPRMQPLGDPARAARRAEPL